MSARPSVCRTVSQLRGVRGHLSPNGESLALVPTMGFLHLGHLSLIAEAKRCCRHAAVSIFVNPLQFGPNEDLARYPRDLEGDIDKCGQAGADLVFCPGPGDLYPVGFQTQVEVTELSKGLCGAHREGHFRGVATVVLKLFNLFAPKAAIFGEKDYQQLLVVRQMARDLDLPLEVVGCPIVREADGLAMSSRNSALSAEERRRATGLYRSLCAAQERFAAGERHPEILTRAATDVLVSAGATPEYVELRDATTLQPVDEAEQGQRLLVAAHVGRTRLIDNLALALAPPLRSGGGRVAAPRDRVG
jgi:pantoate--beta-alanine ligase